MTVSRADRLPGWAACALAASLAGYAAAQEQDPGVPPSGAPIELAPQGQVFPQSQPLPTEQQQEQPATPPSDELGTQTWGQGTQTIGRKPGSVGGMAAPAIEVGGLNEVDVSTAGLLGAGDGLPSTLWNGTSRAQAEALLARVPLSMPSPAMQTLYRKVLLSVGQSPRGDGALPWFGVRLQRLMDAGLVGDIGPLAAQGGGSLATDERVQRIRADGLLYAGDPAAACGDGTAYRLQSGEPYWMKLRAYCYAVGGDKDAALLTLDLMQTQGIGDPQFQPLLARVAEGVKLPKDLALTDMSALGLTMAAAAELAVPEALADEAPLAAKALIARNAKTDPKVRLYAAEAAALAGGLPLADLEAVYAAVPFKPAELAAAASTADLDPSPRANAVLYQAVTKAADPRATASALLDAFAMADRLRVYPLMARLYAARAAALPVSPDLAFAAPELARALMLGGEPEAAQAWLRYVDTGNPDSRLNGSAMQIHLAIAGRGGDAANAMAFLATAIRPGADFSDPLYRRVALDTGLLGALGQPVLQEARLQLPDTVVVGADMFMPLDPMRKELREAAFDSRVAATALLALAHLGPRGPRGAHPMAVIEAVEALHQVGLVEDARAIALEAALAQPYFFNG